MGHLSIRLLKEDDYPCSASHYSMPVSPFSGLHHVTAICSNAQRTIDFYTDILGLRLTKLTVNFDDPYSYHLYFTDDRGNPGTTLTFFVWPDAGPGQAGIGQTMLVGFSVPQRSLAFWTERLVHKGVKHENVFKRFEESVLRFRDPDGMLVELCAHPKDDPRAGWTGGGVAPEHSIRGLHHVTLLEDGYEDTAKLLTDTIGFRTAGQNGSIHRFETGYGGPGTYVDIHVAPDFLKGRLGTGTIHHIALRVPDDATENEYRSRIIAESLNPTPVIDRNYFHSVYFHEPGGVLLEIATDVPGFMVDQTYEKLGSEFTVPPWYEERKKEIQSVLPPVRIPPFPRQST
ncbi:MAG: Ring-cleaving dioxygenase [Candidatus Peribacteria bacterium]|nr:Ring-cleaving dioxygenase [Candidatus Peribacteria bacterium]